MLKRRRVQLTHEELVAIAASPGMSALRRVMRSNVVRARNGFLVLVIGISFALYRQEQSVNENRRAIKATCAESTNRYNAQIAQIKAETTITPVARERLSPIEIAGLSLYYKDQRARLDATAGPKPDC